MAVRPEATRFLHLLPHGNTSLSKGSTSWVFRATLPDGSKFAIDLCNAQYSTTTAEQRYRAIFPWDEYLQRLEVPNGPPLDTQPLEYCITKIRGGPLKGSVNSAKAGIFVEEDVRAHIHSLSASANVVASNDKLIMPLPKLDSVVGPASEERDYKLALEKYKATYGYHLHLSRRTVDSSITGIGFFQTLLMRLRRQAGNSQV